jgi:hypothetical protein
MPIAELVKLTVDGQEVKPERIETKGRARKAQNDVVDVYHAHPVTAAGKHVAEVTVRLISTGKEHKQRVEFEV